MISQKGGEIKNVSKIERERKSKKIRPSKEQGEDKEEIDTE